MVASTGLNPDSDQLDDGAWSYAGASGGIADTTAVALKAAVAGKRIVLQGLQISNSDATVGTEVEILSAATVIWRGYAPPVGASPQNHYFPEQVLKTAAGEALNVKAVTTSAQLIVSAQGLVID